ncbi:hypothetical protein [Mesorhizobium sp. CO1-1-11]|nr:hypothetical protein [Mesorhizobium sp. CO1-1-11]
MTIKIGHCEQIPIPAPVADEISKNGVILSSYKSVLAGPQPGAML